LAGLEAMMFAWDQCVAMGFWPMLPRLLFAVIRLTREALLAAPDMDAMNAALEARYDYDHTFTLMVRPLQSAMT
jgi:hypothetical protein